MMCAHATLTSTATAPHYAVNVPWEALLLLALLASFQIVYAQWLAPAYWTSIRMELAPVHVTQASMGMECRRALYALLVATVQQDHLLQTTVLWVSIRRALVRVIVTFAHQDLIHPLLALASALYA